MIKCSTYKPGGNKFRCSQVYGLGQELLRVTDELRAQMGVPFLSNRRTIDNGLTTIVVLASQDHNSQINIFSIVPPEGEPSVPLHRIRLLHCRIELTLSEDDLVYEKDPAFIAVEPIPISENVVTLHVLFEVDARRGITIKELHDDDAEDLPEDISLEDAADLIYKATNYNLLKKILDDEDEPIQIANQVEQVVPPEAVSYVEGEEGETDFKNLMDSSFWDQTGEEDELLDGYDYQARTIATGLATTMVAWMNEPAARSESTMLQPREYEEYLDENGVTKRRVVPTDEVEHTHLAQSFSSYYDSIVYEVSDTNIHPIGNRNDVKLVDCYGLTLNLASPFTWVTTDFTPRIDDKVFIGDIATAATRNKVRYITKYVYDEDSRIWVLTNLYPDAKLVSNILPYYIESKATREIAEEFADLATDWQCYTDAPVPYILTSAAGWVDIDTTAPGYEYFGDTGDEMYYGQDHNNWLMHPFMNRTWGTNLFDCRNVEHVFERETGRPWYLHSGFSQLYDIYDSDGIDRFHAESTPNRAILCIRVFFANTESPTSFAGIRRSYDVTFPICNIVGGEYGNRLTENHEAYTGSPAEYEVYDEIPTETSQPLSTDKCPNFITEKGDAVVVNLLSSIYAVCDYPVIVEDGTELNNEEDLPPCSANVDNEDGLPLCSFYLANKGDSITDRREYSKRIHASNAFRLSPRHAGLDFTESAPVGDVSDVVSKRPWPAIMDGDWKFTNIYGAGVSIGLISSYRNKLEFYTESEQKRLISGDAPYKFYDRMTCGESIYSDSLEDLDQRYVEDEEAVSAYMIEVEGKVPWKEEDTPESHIIHSIYRALDKAGFDKHHPICDIKLEANLYDQYVKT